MVVGGPDKETLRGLKAFVASESMAPWLPTWSLHRAPLSQAEVAVFQDLSVSYKDPHWWGAALTGAHVLSPAFLQTGKGRCLKFKHLLHRRTAVYVTARFRGAHQACYEMLVQCVARPHSKWRLLANREAYRAADTRKQTVLAIITKMDREREDPCNLCGC